MKTIVAFAATREGFRFFARIGAALRPIGYDVCFITPKLSTYSKALAEGFRCRLIRTSTNRVPQKHFDRMLEVLTGELSTEDASQYYYGIRQVLDEIHESTPMDRVMIWNGASVAGNAMSDFAHEHKIKTIFFEISNIRGKVFVDPTGVNASSLLYSKPSILSQFGNVSELEFTQWRDDYLQRKAAEVTTPGAAGDRRVRNILFPLDLIGTLFFRLPGGGDMNPFSRAAEKYRHHRTPVLDHYPYTSRSFILYPMQVRNDSQLLLNSDLTNGSAIDLCLKRSAALGVDLVIKLHPMESDEKTVRSIRTNAAGRPVYIVAAPTMQLVQHAREVVTINSTVGLEAMIAGTPVTFLGRSFFPVLTREWLKQYLLRYLMNVEYYSDAQISQETALSIVQRADLQ